jgi:hypothetical protein
MPIADFNRKSTITPHQSHFTIFILVPLAGIGLK